MRFEKELNTFTQGLYMSTILKYLYFALHIIQLLETLS